MDSMSLDNLSMPVGEDSLFDAVDLNATFQHLWTMRILTDIDFEVKNPRETQIFRAHKLVLSVWSPVFADMFSDKKGKEMSLISVKDVSSAAFRFVLRYMYGFESIFRKYKHAFEVCKVAEKYQIKGLKDKARRFILSAHVTPKNALQLLEPASFYSSKSLKERCFKILQTQTMQVLRDENLYHVSSCAIETILAMPQLSLHSEYELIEWIHAWGKNQYFKESSCSNEREIMEPLLPSLRFQDLSCEEFATYVKLHKEFFDENEAFCIFMNIANPGSWPLPVWVDTTKTPRVYRNPK